jgi:fibronectin-binding autotransporter adhesin
MQRSTTCAVIAILMGALALLFGTSAHAQYTADYQTNIISGVTSNWSGDYIVGSSNTYADVLLIQSSGVLSNGSGSVGGPQNEGGSSNVAVVSGPGSVWNNSDELYVGGGGGDANQLIVTNGGAVYSLNAQVGSEYAYYNSALVTGSGSVWNNTSDLNVGYPEGAYSSLTISDGGVVYDNNAQLGTIQNGGNTTLVTGIGSVWSNQSDLTFGGEGGDSLIISNGGTVYDSYALVAGDEANESVLVTGTGSVWNTSGEIEMAYSPDSLTVSGGGVVYCGSADMRGSPGPYALVTGAGSVWSIGSTLVLNGSSESLTVADGGVVFVPSVTLSIGANEIIVTGGGLYVTNGLGTGGLEVEGHGALTLNGGTVTANQLLVDGTSSSTFTSGLLTSGGTVVSNGQSFAVGDGTNAAMFQLASGGSGIHSFANGLTISSNAFLTGCGTIEGSAVVDCGGTVVANCGGTLTFTGIVTNNGTMQALNGSVLEAYSNLVNNGVIDVRGGTTNFHGGFINNGIVITTNNFPVVTAIQVVGPDVEIGVKTGNGNTYVFEEATNLTGASWTPVIEFTGPGGVVTFIDPGAATLPQRFYRVGLIPSP